MSNTARKARKRAGKPFVKARKKPTARHGDTATLGMISRPEIMARILARSTR